jgi:cytochrome P450
MCTSSIPPGTFLWLDLYALHRDPALWPRPDEFLPQRHLVTEEPVAAWATSQAQAQRLAPLACGGFSSEEVAALAPKHPSAYLPFGHGSRCSAVQCSAVAQLHSWQISYP